MWVRASECVLVYQHATFLLSVPGVYTHAVQTILTDFTINDTAVFVVPNSTFSYCTLIGPGRHGLFG